MSFTNLNGIKVSETYKIIAVKVSGVIVIATELQKYAFRILTLCQSLHTPAEKKDDPFNKTSNKDGNVLSDGYRILISGCTLIRFFKVTRKSGGR